MGEAIARALAREGYRLALMSSGGGAEALSTELGALGVSGSEAVERALEIHRDYLMNETLATDWQVDQANPRYTADKTMGDEHWTIEIGL